MTKKEIKICIIISAIAAALFLGFLYIKMLGY